MLADEWDKRRDAYSFRGWEAAGAGREGGSVGSAADRPQAVWCFKDWLYSEHVENGHQIRRWQAAEKELFH